MLAGTGGVKGNEEVKSTWQISKLVTRTYSPIDTGREVRRVSEKLVCGHVTLEEVTENVNRNDEKAEKGQSWKY